MDNAQAIHNDAPDHVSVGVIGGSAGMGRWLADFLAQAGCEVTVADLETEHTAPDVAQSVDVLFVAVPIGVTLEVIAQVGALVRPGGALADITSLKEREVSAMLEAAPADVEVFGTHPLFGPRSASVEGRNFITCPGRGDRWLTWFEQLLADRGAVVTRTDAGQHDEMMSIVQGLEHFSTVATGLALRELGVPTEQFAPFATPSFGHKVDAIRRVFCDNPRLYGEIMAQNPRNERVVEAYLGIAHRLAEAVSSGDAESLTQAIAEGSPYYCDNGD